ncbi:MAG: hypothetical protein M3Y42_11050 [Actinomycetota bacterium]|nr:hypothetical protein [Actinomycetota bacterium]MDQ2957491.1 hypothetical protein [Actinomycetota bacterium]
MTIFSLTRTAAVAAAVVAGALLSPAVSAQAGIPQCTPDNCDTITYYFSDATHTVLVGEHEDGPCGYIDTGVQTAYVTISRRTC